MERKKAVQRQSMGILLCEQNFRNVWIRNESVRAEIGQILHTDTHPHTHTTAAKLVVRIYMYVFSGVARGARGAMPPQSFGKCFFLE